MQGVRGEIIDNNVYYLDDNNEGQIKKIDTDVRIIKTQELNPNLSSVCEIEKISFGSEVLYEPEFGLCGLSEDALADAYAAILLDEAVKTGGRISSDFNS